MNKIGKELYDRIMKKEQFKMLTGLEALDSLIDYGEWLPALEIGIIREELKRLEMYDKCNYQTTIHKDVLQISIELSEYEKIKEKEQPMKVELFGDGYADGELIYDTAICPRCGREFEIDNEENYRYCPDCGQRLDWKIEEVEK